MDFWQELLVWRVLPNNVKKVLSIFLGVFLHNLFQGYPKNPGRFVKLQGRFIFSLHLHQQMISLKIFHNHFKIFWYCVLLKTWSFFCFYSFWGSAKRQLNWKHSIVWDAILVQQHWKLELEMKANSERHRWNDPQLHFAVTK